MGSLLVVLLIPLPNTRCKAKEAPNLLVIQITRVLGICTSIFYPVAKMQCGVVYEEASYIQEAMLNSLSAS